jgi:hypothetical protein
MFVTCRFDGANRVPAEASNVVKPGPEAQPLLSLFVTVLTCHVYEVFGDKDLRSYGDFALLSSTFPGDTFTSNFVPPPLGPSQLNETETEVMLVNFKFEGATSVPADASRVVNAGPDTQALLSLFVTVLTCQVYAVFGDKDLTSYGDFALLSSTFPGDTFTSNFVPPPLGPSQLNDAEAEVMFVTCRFDGATSVPADASNVVKPGPETQALLSLFVIVLTCHVYGVFGDKDLRSYGEFALPSLMFPGETLSSNFVPP